MSTNSNSHIISIYKARKHLLEILKHRGFTIKSSDINIISVDAYNFLWIKNMGKNKNYI